MKKDVCKNCLLGISLHLAQLLIGKFLKEVLQTSEREKNTPAHHLLLREVLTQNLIKSNLFFHEVSFLLS